MTSTTSARASSVRLGLALALLLLASTASAALDPLRLRAAQVHSDAGLKLYRLGDYAAAIPEFETARAIIPLPAFLVNVAQCYRKLGELDRARDFYRRFLTEAPSDIAPHHERADVVQILTAIDRQIAARASAAALAAAAAGGAPDPSLAVAPSSRTIGPLEGESAGSAKVALSRRRWAWAVAAVTAAVVAGGAIGLGVGLSRRPPSTDFGSMTVSF